MLILIALAFWVTIGHCQVVYEDAGTFLIEHTAKLAGEFREAELWVPIPLNWPMQTASDLTVDPPDAEIVLDESKTIGLAVLSIPGPATEASLTVRYKVRCHPPKFDKAALDARTYPPYDEDSEVYKQFTAPSTRIESGTPRIAALGKKFVESEANPYRRARAIYDYVIDACSYSDGPARGAAAMLERRVGCCADYAQLFAAVCRAADIPARECAGYTAGKDSNWHSWAEFYLPEVGWVPCDPQTGDSHDEAADTYFASLGGSPHVVLAKVHDFSVMSGGRKHTTGFIQSGRVRCQGTCRATYTVTSKTVSPVRYCALLVRASEKRSLRADLTEAELIAANEEAKSDGLRCISVTVAPGPTGLTYAAVWEKNARSERWQLYPRLSVQQYRGLVAQARGQARMMPVSVASCLSEGTPVYAAVFADDLGRDWSEASGLSQEQFAQRLRDELQARRAPISLAAYQESGRAVCAGVFVRLTQSAAVSSSLWHQSDEFDATLARYQTEGYIPTAIAATAGHPAYFHCVGIKTGQRTSWSVLRDLPGADLEKALASAANSGYQPRSIAAY